MENPKKNSVFVHEDFEKWPKASPPEVENHVNPALKPRE
jgi:hypothetical protein